MNLVDLMPKKAERSGFFGGTGSGKSTALEVVIKNFLDSHASGVVAIADTKPRFRAEWMLSGMRAKYPGWDHGPTLPGSVAWDPHARDYGIPLALQLGHRIVVLQDHSQTTPGRIAVLDAINVFFRGARASKPRLLGVDELMDFYSAAGATPRGAPDSILRVVRAGREKGMSAALASQRTRRIPQQVLCELSRTYLFRLDRESDVDNLIDNGAVPAHTIPPQQDHVFFYFEKKTRKSGYYKFKL